MFLLLWYTPCVGPYFLGQSLQHLMAVPCLEIVLKVHTTFHPPPKNPPVTIRFNLFLIIISTCRPKALFKIFHQVLSINVLMEEYYPHKDIYITASNELQLEKILLLVCMLAHGFLISCQTQFESSHLHRLCWV